VGEPLLPDTTSDESDVGWGDDERAHDQDGGADEDDERLKAERPPHHDRP
jgi:hypothetical protein